MLSSTKIILIFFRKTGRLVYLASLVFFTSFAQASDEKMGDVAMTSCHKDFCVSLKSARLFKSSIGNQYAFGPSEIKIDFSGKLGKKLFVDFEGSFHPLSQRFYLSKKSSQLEYMIDLEKQKVVAFKKP